jgi:hypothetical protein
METLTPELVDHILSYIICLGNSDLNIRLVCKLFSVLVKHPKLDKYKMLMEKKAHMLPPLSRNDLNIPIHTIAWIIHGSLIMGKDFPKISNTTHSIISYIVSLNDYSQLIFIKEYYHEALYIAAKTENLSVVSYLTHYYYNIVEYSMLDWRLMECIIESLPVNSKSRMIITKFLES